MSKRATATMGLRQRKKQQTREAIANAAVELFATQGFHQTTIREIALGPPTQERRVYFCPNCQAPSPASGGPDR